MLLVALVLITLTSLLLAMAIQPANSQSQRLKEAELIYRGTHLAEGIKRFYGTYGRFPFELEELIKEEPRFIRKLYKDPMTKDGDWTLVYLSATDLQAVQGLNSATRKIVEATSGESLEEGEGGEVNSENAGNVDGPGLTQDPNSVFNLQRPQITGIRSKSEVQGFKVRDESQLYSDWLFTALPKPKDAVSLENLLDQGNVGDK